MGSFFRPSPPAPPGGGGGVTDHGALTGLEDNDHPQYLLVADLPEGGAWDGELPLADAADITEGNPTFQVTGVDPRTTPGGQSAQWHITTTGSPTGSYLVGAAVINVDDLEADIQAAIDEEFMGMGMGVSGDADDWVLTQVDYGVGDEIVLDDSGLSGGSASIEQTAPGRSPGLVRPIGSVVRVLDMGGPTLMLMEQLAFDATAPNWVRVGSNDFDNGDLRKTVVVGAAGANGDVLTADDAEPTGVKFAPATAGAVVAAGTSTLTLSQGGATPLDLDGKWVAASTVGVESGSALVVLDATNTVPAGTGEAAQEIYVNLFNVIAAQPTPPVPTAWVVGETIGTWYGVIGGVAAHGTLTIFSDTYLNLRDANGAALTTLLLDADEITLHCTLRLTATP